MKQKPYYNSTIPWTEKESALRNVSWKQYRSCQAWTFYDGDNIWIKSYNTVVAVISRTAGLSIRGHYSRTTSAQITKIYRSYKNGELRTFGGIK